MRRQLGYWKKTQTSWAPIGESVVRDRGFGFPQVLVPAPGVISGQAGVAEHGSGGVSSDMTVLGDGLGRPS